MEAEGLNYLIWLFKEQPLACTVIFAAFVAYLYYLAVNDERS
jgi:hypothetical protein